MNQDPLIKPNRYIHRRENVFIILSGLFLGTLGLINILGISRFVDLSFSINNWTLPMVLPLGVLPYPLTFLCTDIISEFYGKQRANTVVWVGLIINLWICFILWLGGLLYPIVPLDPNTQLPNITHPEYAFFQIRIFTISTVAGSMIAYLAAQLIGVHLFHFWKKLTRGRHLWLRNNGSTMISQLVDTVIVMSIAFFFSGAFTRQPEQSALSQLTPLILSSYIFKFIAALVDTIPFYIIVFSLRRYLNIGSIKSEQLPLFKPTVILH